MAYVYRHIRLDTYMPFYIGIGSDDNGSFKRANVKVGRNRHWGNIRSKAGYRVDIIMDDLSWDEACSKEVELIGLYGRININTGILCNQTNGGEGALGCVKSKETLLKMSKSLTGKKRTPEQRAKLKGLLGKWMIGRKASPETIAKHKRNGQNVSAETREKISKKVKGRKHRPESIEKMRKVQSKVILTDEQLQRLVKYIPVSVYSIETGEKICEYRSIKACAAALNLSYTTVRRCARGELNKSIGYHIVPRPKNATGY